jgi:hypothetical protein
MSCIHSLSPKIFEPLRGKFGVAHRMLNFAVPKVGMEGTGVVALVGQRVSASPITNLTKPDFRFQAARFLRWHRKRKWM